MTDSRRQDILRELALRKAQRERGELRSFDALTWDEAAAATHSAMVLAGADVESVTSVSASIGPVAVS